LARKETSKAGAKTRIFAPLRPWPSLDRHCFETINNSPAVSERLAKRVWQAIEQLNISQHACAQPGVGAEPHSGHPGREHHQPIFSRLIQSFEEIAVAHGYEILVSSTNGDPAVLATCVRRMLERKVGRGCAELRAEERCWIN